MAITFLDAVNDSLIRARVIKGDTGRLTTTMGTASEIFQAKSDIQHSVDLQLQMWREVTQELFTMGVIPPVVATATIVLSDGTREYELPSDFERVAGDTHQERMLRGVTTGVVYEEYPGGYLRMLADQPRATDFTSAEAGRWAISPAHAATTMLRMEFETTTSTQSYNLMYEKSIDLTVTMATETMPFTDTVSFAMVPVVAEFYNRTMKGEGDQGIFRSSIARAARLTRKQPPSETYGKQRRGG